MFFSENFMLGAGAVVIQPSSGKVVVVQDGDHWFLPKGRKDLGESVEQAALREAYEEVRISLHLISSDRFDQRSSVWLSMRIPAIIPLDKRPRRVTSCLRTEAHGATTRYHHLVSWPSKQTAWRIPDFLVRVPDRTRSGKLAPVKSCWSCSSQGESEQVREVGTGMPDEAGYVGHLVTFEVAGELLGEIEKWVLAAARNEWVRSLEIDERIRATEAQQRDGQPDLDNDGERA